jgi:hypothetical protein
MTLIPCPTCSKEISSQASTCPNCGHPVAQGTTHQPRTSRSGVIGLLIVLLLIGIAAAVTKPSESAMKEALLEKHGLHYSVGAIAENVGLVEMKYHDYLIFSTLTVEILLQPERTAAYGVFGKTFVSDTTLPKPGKK